MPPSHHVHHHRVRLFLYRNGILGWTLLGLLSICLFIIVLEKHETATLYEDIMGQSLAEDSRTAYPDKCRIRNYESLKRMSIVYTWVNGSQPCYQQMRQKYGGIHAVGGPRDREMGELKFSIRSMQKYMPWHEGNIYIVTPGHIPEWLDMNNPRIKVINQDDLFPPYAKAFLPSFNTNVIEQFLYRIPGLSEIFMQINDDYIFTSYVAPHEFFTCDGGIRLLHETTWISHATSPATLNKYRSSVRNTQQEMDLRWGRQDRYFIKHAPFIYSRRAFTRIHQIFARQLYMTLKSKFRAKTDMSIPLLHHYYMVAEGSKELGIPIVSPPDHEMNGFQLIKLRNDNMDDVKKIFDAIIAGTHDSKIVALNDDYENLTVQENVKWFFKMFLPEPSAFELHDDPEDTSDNIGINNTTHHALSIRVLERNCEVDPLILPPTPDAILPSHNDATFIKLILRREVRWILFIHATLQGAGFGLCVLLISSIYAQYRGSEKSSKTT